MSLFFRDGKKAEFLILFVENAFLSAFLTYDNKLSKHSTALSFSSKYK